MSNDGSRSPSPAPAEEKDIPTASTSNSQHEQSPSSEQEQDDQQVTRDSKTPSETEDGDNKDTIDKDNKGQEEASESKDIPTATAASASTPTAGDWQAVWSPAHNAYYFFNARTGETTWTNPLQPGTSNAVASSSSSLPAQYPSTSTAPASSTQALYAAAEAAGIDPSLAYLDPTLATPGQTPAGTFVAKFNARTGAFAKTDARDPSHLSEAERAKRMSQVYFDVNAWEEEVAQRYEEEEAGGKKRKRPTKKDLERFKEQKRQKKIAKTAWLRT